MNIVNKKCIFDLCNIQACYNYENKKNGLYCTKHKLKDMIDISNKRCNFESCLK
jgi:hypothetical protein